MGLVFIIWFRTVQRRLCILVLSFLQYVQGNGQAFGIFVFESAT